MSARSITAYPMDADVAALAEALTEPARLDERPLRSDLPFEGAVFVAPRQARAPDWVPFLEAGLGAPLADVRSLFPAAVLVLRVDERVVALPFGLGRTLIDLERVERGFGLKVALNEVDPERLRSLDTAVVEELVVRTRRQVSRGSAPEAFGLDDRRDILRAVTGEPRDRSLGRRITGADAIQTNIDIEFEGLGSLTSQFLAARHKTTYQERFAFIDQIARVDRDTLIARLDRELVAAVRGEQKSDVYLAPPQIVDWDQIRGFRYPGQSSGVEPDIDLDLNSYLSRLPDPDKVELADLRRQTIRVVDPGGDERARWQVYRCLVFEVELDERRYILSEGQWFAVDREYAQEIDAAVHGLDKATFTLPAAGHNEEEGDYNARAATGAFHLLDKLPFTVGRGERRTIEVCDLLSDGRQLVHVKRKTRSSTLSHLFAQGRISASALKGDRHLRDRVRAHLATLEPSLPALVPEPFRAQDFEVIYAVVAPNAGLLPDALPFFSKLNLVHSVELVRDALEFQVSFLGIPHLGS